MVVFIKKKIVRISCLTFKNIHYTNPLTIKINKTQPNTLKNIYKFSNLLMFSSRYTKQLFDIYFKIIIMLYKKKKLIYLKIYQQYLDIVFYII